VVAQIVCNRWGKLVVNIYNTVSDRIGYKALVSKFGKDFYMPVHLRAIGRRGDKNTLTLTVIAIRSVIFCSPIDNVMIKIKLVLASPSRVISAA